MTRKKTNTKKAVRKPVAGALTSLEDRVLDMRARGLSIAEISKEEGIPPQQAIDIVRDKEAKMLTMKAVYLEKRYKDAGLDSDARIMRLKDMQDILIAELEARGLGEVSGDKLVTLILKTGEQIRAEIDSIPRLSFQSQAEQEEAQFRKSIQQ